MSVVGSWPIIEMELWAEEDVDLVGPASIQFGDDGMGRFGLIAVEGWMDWREAGRDGRPGVEFSWEGTDDGDPASGRGWAVLNEEGALHGRIYFHLGDDHGFRAERVEGEATRAAKSAVGSHRLR